MATGMKVMNLVAVSGLEYETASLPHIRVYRYVKNKLSLNNSYMCLYAADHKKQ